MVYIMPSLAHFHGWTLVGEVLLHIVHLLLQFKEKEGQGFADIIVDSCGLLCLWCVLYMLL